MPVSNLHILGYKINFHSPFQLELDKIFETLTLLKAKHTDGKASASVSKIVAIQKAFDTSTTSTELEQSEKAVEKPPAVEKPLQNGNVVGAGRQQLQPSRTKTESETKASKSLRLPIITNSKAAAESDEDPSAAAAVADRNNSCGSSCNGEDDDDEDRYCFNCNLVAKIIGNFSGLPTAPGLTNAAARFTRTTASPQ